MPESATHPPAGLLTTARAPVPLAGVSVNADLTNLCARVTVTQRYVNRETTAIEAVYVFPLDESAAVCGFEAIVDGTLVVGEVKEREEAFRIYDDAMEQGHGAFLLDEERPDVFQASVGNLPPGKDVLLKLTYVTELAVAAGSIRFTIPTTVAPRYAPAEDRIAVGRPDSETLNPPLQWQVPYGLDLSIRLSMTGAIARVESPSHPIALTMDGGRATVVLSQRDAALDRDFVLSVDAPDLAAPQARVEMDDDVDDAVAIAFAPELPETTAPAEVIFVVDRSGSMEGTSIEEVRSALHLCLRSLVPGCRFNIVGFGSSVATLFPECRQYDEASLAQASRHVSNMAADLGGTEILPALRAAFEPPRHGTLTRQIVVLTDGEITNTDAVIALAHAHATYARIFTFGIGAGPSQHLVKALARAGGGASEFIVPGERIAAKVARQLAKALAPALTNIRVDWGGLEVKQAPSAVPAVFSGGRLLVYGLLKQPRDRRRPATVRLLADTVAGPATFDVHVDPTRADAGRTAATLAARARIRELEEHPEWVAARGSRQRDRKAPASAREIIELSVRYGLISRETSYVAVERRDTPVAGDVQLRRVPVALVSGWGGATVSSLAAGIVGAVPGARRLGGSVRGFAPPPMAARASLSFDDVVTGRPAMKESWFPWRRRTAPDLQSVEPTRGSAIGGDTLAMQQLIELQHADGSWDLTKAFALATGHKLSDLERTLKLTGPDTGAAGKIWATALAVAWLEANARMRADEWRLVAQKARSWLAGIGGGAAQADAWLAAARAAFGQPTA